jgi:hypothetical protein
MRFAILSVLKLELWKQRKTFLSTVLVLVLGVAVPAALLPMVRSVRVIESFSGAAAFLVLLMPLVIVFLAASAGAPLRKTEHKNHEELLPVHPFLRVYGAYFVSFCYTAVILLLSLSLLGIQEVFYIANYRMRLFELSFAVLLLYAWSLHSLSFAITYVLNLPVLAAGISLILATVDLFFRAAFVYYFRYWSVDQGWVVLTLPLPIALVLISLAIAAKKLERGSRLGFKAGAPLLLCFLLGPIWTILLACSISRDEPSRCYHGTHEREIRAPEAPE